MGKQIVSAAPGSEGVKWEDYKGKLFVIEPLEFEQGLTTVHSKTPGDTTAVRANVFVVQSKDGSKYEEFEDTLIFPKALQGQTRRQIGSLVVGRLAQGEKKPGKNAPWVLSEASDTDLKAAGAFWAARSVSSASSGSNDDEGEGYEDESEDSF